MAFGADNLLDRVEIAPYLIGGFCHTLFGKGGGWHRFDTHIFQLGNRLFCQHVTFGQKSHIRDWMVDILGEYHVFQ